MMTMTAPRQPILVVLHRDNSAPGRVGHALQERGYPLDIRRPCFGDPLPDTLAEHAGAIIFGGPMSANDADDFVRREIGVDRGAAEGAQTVPRHLSRRPDAGAPRSAAGSIRMPRATSEIGYYPIRPTELGRTLCDPWPEQVYQWHREGFDLPSGAELLAEGDTFPVQAFRIGSAYALQFHPEVTHATICRWTMRGHERTLLPGAKQRAAHFADRAVYDPAGRAWLAAFLDHWLAQEE